MKKCPKCQAEIQENARFCLYCMTSFEEKKPMEPPQENNKRWPYILAAVLVFVFVFCGIFAFKGKDKPSDPSSNTYAESQTSSNNDSNITENNNTTSKAPLQNSESTTNEQSTSSKDKSQVQSTLETENNTTSNHTTTNNGASANTTTSNTTSNTPTSTDTTTSRTVSNTSTTTQPNYNYIEATVENTYPTGYSAMYAPENAIVITKVNYKEESGNYVIPDTIDGKKVAAIMPSAFCDASIRSTVKSVTLPSTVRTIWSDAFKDCYNLKDIYIKSSVIGIYPDAFPEPAKRTDTLTIHCAKDCRDFDFYYYRNIADNYDAEYEEWNG